MTPTQEIDLKSAKVAAFLDRHGLDVILLTRRANFAWLTAGCANHVAQASEIGASTLIATRDGIRTPVVLIAADDRIERYRHPLPTERKIDARVMTVVCGERHGLNCSATRLVSFGPLPAELRRRHDAVVRVDATLISETKPGRTLGEVFNAGQRAYAESGYADEWMHHHQGGSTGYVGREVRAAPGCPVQALGNQAFAWNPSLAGTKSEDTILVTDAGTEILTQAVDWPMIEVKIDGTNRHRPDILCQG
jgi:Xaa-Pro aminopeptidase